MTLLEWLEKVKALSKKSTEGAVVVFSRNIYSKCSGGARSLMTGQLQDETILKEILPWCGRTEYAQNTPWQSVVLQTSASAGSPRQRLLAALPAVQERILHLDPWSHELEHWDHSDQAVQLAITAGITF